MEKFGCGRKIKIGYNKILNCPITFQCGMSKKDGEVMFCEYCQNIKDGRGNSIHASYKVEDTK